MAPRLFSEWLDGLRQFEAHQLDLAQVFLTPTNMQPMSRTLCADSHLSVHLSVHLSRGGGDEIDGGDGEAALRSDQAAAHAAQPIPTTG